MKTYRKQENDLRNVQDQKDFERETVQRTPCDWLIPKKTDPEELVDKFKELLDV